MKLKFNFIFISLVLLAGCRPPEAPSSGDDAQRVVALVDYVRGDYPGAVQNGAVVSPTEYQEQLRFVGEARTLTEGLLGTESDPLLEELSGLESLLKNKAEPEDVRKACLVVRDQAIARFHLRTTPTERPNLVRAKGTYRQACAVCHGVAGDAGTQMALDPPPVSFRDPKRLGGLSPYRVFNSLTFGVPGTAMPSFEALTPTERWELAFYVFRLGHNGEPTKCQTTLPLSEIALRTDDELLSSLRSESSPKGALAYLRLEAPFQEPTTAVSFDRARALLHRAAAAYREGHRAEADRGVLDAYLQGFEPFEAPLRVRDSSGTATVEKAFQDLRAAIARGTSPAEFDAREVALETRMLDLQEAGARPFLPALASATIFVREGLEAALLVGALLAGVRRLGRSDATRYLHAGWILALPAGLLTWFALDRLVILGSEKRELLEGLVSLIAAFVLFTVSFWMISKAESRHWMAYLKRSVEESLSERRLLLLAGLAFLAVYREAAETALFLQALLLQSPGERREVLLGAVLGLALVGILAFVLNRTVLKLPLGPFFAVSSLLLCVLAISFAGAGIHVLVSAGYVPPRPVRFPEVDWMGIHPDLTGLLVQFGILSVVAGAAVLTLKRRLAGVQETRR